jgi:hypothetical protein
MDLFIKLNSKLEDVNYYFTNDVKINGNNIIEFTSVYNDMNVIPIEWYENGLACVKEVQQMASWLNKNVFQLMINNLLWKNKMDCTTELVKKRIFISKLKNLPITETNKIDWEFWVNELYWARKRAIIDYYLSNVVELPF